ncbi:GNAT family N-acetyltransferase [Microbacterium sp. 179-I 1D1 NHS]|uniref:N-acetyltransferase family protein n=1 Tax=Microbacterium sp. 179-I 1D1 NHS TaxID=3374298 RepID=UPI0038792773
MPESWTLRSASRADGVFLGEMVVEAANWRPGPPRPRHDVLADPFHSRYLAAWMRPGDVGFVAVAGAEDIGAAWYRTLPRIESGFGYVGSGVPELVIGVKPLWRSHGVGRALLRRLCETARAQGRARISLSVERGNFAQVLYRSEGFAVTRSGIGRDTMVKRLG